MKGKHINLFESTYWYRIIPCSIMCENQNQGFCDPSLWYSVFMQWVYKLVRCYEGDKYLWKLTWGYEKVQNYGQHCGNVHYSCQLSTVLICKKKNNDWWELWAWARGIRRQSLWRGKSNVGGGEGGGKGNPDCCQGGEEDEARECGPIEIPRPGEEME